MGELMLGHAGPTIKYKSTHIIAKAPVMESTRSKTILPQQPRGHCTSIVKECNIKIRRDKIEISPQLLF
jgi:hypothetical protein